MARNADASNGTPVPPQANEGDENNGSKAPSYEELQQRIEGQSRLLGKLTSAMERLEKNMSAPKAPEEKPEEKTLTERQKRLEQEWAQKTQKARDRAVKQTIAGALQAEGITDPALAQRQANFLRSELFDRISVDDDTDAVTIDDNGTQVPVEKYLHAYLATPEGNWLLPQKRPPNDKGAAKGFGASVGSDGKLRISKEEFSRGKFSKAVAERIAKGDFEILMPDEE